jgi:CRISPR-associated protein Cas1
METVYIADNGIVLKKRSQRIILKKDRKVLEEIPVLDLKRLIILGNNQISTDLLHFLSSKGIDIAFLSSSGRFKFRIVSETSKNIYLRMAQHHSYGNDVFRISWAKRIIRAKLTNQRNFLKRCQRNNPALDLGHVAETLKNSIQKLDQEGLTLDKIMGIEGFASKTYFKAYGKTIAKTFEFNKREYYPPPDPVNALLSFGYMLLFNELNSLLEAFGFDIFLGFLHSAKYGRASLATDMIEEFRSPVIDRLVMYLINKNVIKADQFSAKAKRGVKMNDKARKSFLKNYEKFMVAPFVDLKTRRQMNYRKIIKENVIKLERLLLDNTEYEPYSFYS